jgi:hypothetical protein
MAVATLVTTTEPSGMRRLLSGSRRPAARGQRVRDSEVCTDRCPLRRVTGRGNVLAENVSSSRHVFF